MDNLPALGFCPTCRESLITQNGIPKCFNCAPSKKLGNKPPPAVDIPNETEFNNVIKNEVGKVYSPPVIGKAGVVTTGGTAQDALDIMHRLPMPKDMKEFKQIQKIIKQLEKLVGENYAK